MLYMHEYDPTFVPAMPVVEISIGKANAAPTLSLLAIVDSGADSSILPLTFLRQVSARKYAESWMVGIGNQRTRADLYRISLRLGDFEQARLTVAAGQHPTEAIIGRDILNQFVVTLDAAAFVVQFAR